MTHFCTYCDHRYLPRALAMVESLERHFGPFTLWVLALSQECERLLAALGRPDVRVVPLAALEAFDGSLAEAKKNRSLVEYYFTLSPCWPRYLLRTHPDIQSLTYLDSDLYFFSTPQPIFAELDHASIGIIPHRFPPARESAEACHGRYNVGWITWKSDPSGLACLEDWRRRCLEWCHDRCEDGKYADQGYLDAWPDTFRGVHVVRHPGANVAPWNIARHAIEEVDGMLRCDGAPLIFYHFHGIARFDDRHSRTNLEHVEPSWRRRRQLALSLYQPYMRAVARARDRLGDLGHADDLFHLPRFVQHNAPPAANRSGLTRRIRVAARVFSGRLVRHDVA